MSAPILRTRLNCENMEAREVMSASFGIDAGLVPDPTPVMVAATAQDDAIPVVTPARAVAPMAAASASPGVTRVPPTARDIVIMNRLANKKWQLRTTVTNPYTGGAMDITAEIVFRRGGRFSLIQMGTSFGPFGPAQYPASSEGRWWVQNNGVLVMHHLNPWPAEYWVEWQFMRIQSVNNTRFVSPDSGRWFRIPLNTTGIPGLL